MPLLLEFGGALARFDRKCPRPGSVALQVADRGQVPAARLPPSVGGDFPDEPGGCREAVERGHEEDGGLGGGREATSRL